MRTHGRGAARACLCLAAALFACSSDFGEPPSESGSQFIVQWAGDRMSAEVFVFVVDDALESRPLKTVIAEAWRNHVFTRGSCRAPYDPAVWEPVDRSVIIVRPSAPEPERYLTSLDNALLRWVGVAQQDEDAAAAFTQAGADALLGHEAPGAEPPRLLEIIARTAGLISGATTPQTNAEHRLVEALPDELEVRVLLASARDDASPGQVEDYLLPPEFYVDAVVIAGDPERDPERCGYALQPPKSRLGEWADGPGRPASFLEWPCDEFEVFGPALADTSCGSRCLGRPPAIDSSGSAQCRVLAPSPDGDCRQDRGWRNPLLANSEWRPRMEEITRRGYGEVRWCEILQLEGLALESCQHELSCEECEPGWCWTEVPELQSGSCQDHRVPASFRFVNGAKPAGAIVTCNGG